MTCACVWVCVRSTANDVVVYWFRSLINDKQLHTTAQRLSGHCTFVITSSLEKWRKKIQINPWAESNGLCEFVLRAHVALLIPTFCMFGNAWAIGRCVACMRRHAQFSHICVCWTINVTVINVWSNVKDIVMPDRYLESTFFCFQSVRCRHSVIVNHHRMRMRMQWRMHSNTCKLGYASADLLIYFHILTKPKMGRENRIRNDGFFPRNSFTYLSFKWKHYLLLSNVDGWRTNNKTSNDIVIVL